jgi:hypothetical protein
MICLHCKKTEATKPRGLCWFCYADKNVRRLYASKVRRGVGAEHKILCDCCGRSPRNNKTMKMEGWMVRSMRQYGFPSLNETFCPSCFKEFEWGDSLTKIVGVQA